MPDEKDLLAEMLDDEIAVGTEENTKSVDLESKVKELEVANAGLLKAKKAETRKRQESSDRLNQLEGAVGTLLSQRQQQGIESVTEKQAADADKLGIPVTYDEDGNGWVNPNELSGLLSPYATRIQELEQALQQSNASNTASKDATKIKEAIVGSDERFAEAHGKYKAARNWVENIVSEYAKDNKITGRVIPSGEALDNAFDDAAMKEFGTLFEGVNLMDIVTAEDSEMHFKHTLNALSVDPELPGNKTDSRFQRMMSKPSNLGGQANAKAGQLSLLDRVKSQSTDDIMNYTDDQIDALMKLMSE